MCLTVPGKIVRITGDLAVVDYGTQQRTGKLLEEGYREGEYVIIQGGIVTMRIPEDEAEAALALYGEATR